MDTFTHCQQCAGEIPAKKQRIFQTKTRHVLKKEGRIQAGPFCNNTCRAAWISDRATDKLRSAISRNL